MAGVVRQQRLTQRLVGGVLEPAVDCRVNFVSGRVGLVAVRRFHVRPHHLRDVGSLDGDDRPAMPRGHRCGMRLVMFGLVDVVEIQHAPEHVVAAHDPPAAGSAIGLNLDGAFGSPAIMASSASVNSVTGRP